jgi:hypothetical protein
VDVNREKKGSPKRKDGSNKGFQIPRLRFQITSLIFIGIRTAGLSGKHHRCGIFVATGFNLWLQNVITILGFGRVDVNLEMKASPKRRDGSNKKFDQLQGIINT